MREDAPYGLTNEERAKRGWRPIGRPQRTEAEILKRKRDMRRLVVAVEIVDRDGPRPVKERLAEQLAHTLAKWNVQFESDQQVLKREEQIDAAGNRKV